MVAGPSFTNFTGSDAEDWGAVGEKPKMAVRFHGGLVVQYPFNDKLSAISGVQYAVRGAMYEGASFGQLVSAKVKNSQEVQDNF